MEEREYCQQNNNRTDDEEDDNNGDDDDDSSLTGSLVQRELNTGAWEPEGPLTQPKEGLEGSPQQGTAALGTGE